MKKLWIVSCFALFLLAARPSSAQEPGHKIRVLVLTGSSDWSHPWQGTAPFMQGILMNTGRFDVKLEEEVVGITAATLANYDVLIDYYYGPRWGAVTEKQWRTSYGRAKAWSASTESPMVPFSARRVEARRSHAVWKANPGVRLLT
jgi:hypothetical protein